MVVARFPVAAALLVTLLWSSSWVLIKFGLDSLPPLTFAGLRYTAAAAILAAVLAASPTSRRCAAALPGRTWARIVVLGIVLYGVTQAAQFVGLDLMPAATLSLLLSFTPVLVAVTSRGALAEHTHGLQWVGLGCALLGAIAYLGTGLAGASVVGLLVGLLGLVANASSSVLGRAVNRDGLVPALVVTAPSMAVGGVLTLATGVVVEPTPALTAGSIALLAWLAVVNTAFAFTLWNETLRHLTATTSATINNTMLIQIAILGAVFLNEPLTPLQWLGIALAATGALLVQRRAARPVGVSR